MKSIKCALLCVSLMSLSAFAAPKHKGAVEMCSVEEFYYLRTIKTETTNNTGKPQLGALTVVAYSVGKELNGAQVGLSIARRLDLGLPDATPGPNSMMETSVTNFLPGGNLVSLQVTDYDNEKLAEFTRVIVGGTGRFTGANGIVVSTRVKEGTHPVYKSVFKLDIPCSN